MSSNESEEDIFPQQKEDFYGKNTLNSAAVSSTISSKGVERKFISQNAHII